jgi:hypothetical protein
MSKGYPVKVQGKQPGQRVLGAADVSSAIFVDYEKSKSDVFPPTLLGILVEEKLSAAIVDPLFAAQCHGRYRGRHALAADHAATLQEILKRAQKEDRVIVSWSQHDYKVMSAALAGRPKYTKILDEQFRNAIYTSRRWHRLKYPGVVTRNALAQVAGLMGFHIPEKYGTGLVGRGIRLIRRQLEQGRTYAELSDGARHAWQAIVNHNAYDVKTMAAILRKQALLLEKRSG